MLRLDQIVPILTQFRLMIVSAFKGHSQKAYWTKFACRFVVEPDSARGANANPRRIVLCLMTEDSSIRPTSSPLEAFLHSNTHASPGKKRSWNPSRFLQDLQLF